MVNFVYFCIELVFGCILVVFSLIIVIVNVLLFIVIFKDLLKYFKKLMIYFIVGFFGVDLLCGLFVELFFVLYYFGCFFRVSSEF